MNHILKMVYPDQAGVYHDATGELEMALKCYTGRGVTRDEARARRILDALHQRSRAFAAMCLGFMQDHGIAVIADHDDAEHWYREAAIWFDREARLGDPSAFNNIGFLKAKGLGNGVDAKGALHHFAKSSAAGCTAATYNVGVCHLQGIGVARDPGMAVGFLVEAEEEGDAFAPYVLGQMFQAGVGVIADPYQALTYFQIGAGRGNTEAMSALGYAFGVGLGCDKDLQISAHWFEQAAGLGDTYAQANLAMIWCQVDDPASFQKGWDALSNASRDGDLNARYQLAQVLLRGVACQTADHRAARELLSNLAEQGHPGGRHLLGTMLEKGLGGPVDLKRAAAVYRAAAEKGSANAQAALARLYLLGLGVQSDEALAYYWYSLAAPVENTHAWDELQDLESTISDGDRARADRMLALGNYRKDLNVDLRLH
jgi:TPR repeat protein